MDGLSTADEYCKRANDLGIKSLALTDHSTQAGHRDFLRACNKNNIKAILGVEAHLAGGMELESRFERKSKAKRQDGEDSELYYHLILLAKNQNGLNNIYRMQEKAWNESFYNKPLIGLDLLNDFNEDVIATTACVSGPVARNLINGKDDYALKWLMTLKDIFKDDLYAELQDHNQGISEGLNHKLLKMADDNDVKAFASRDCHHASPEDLWLQEALLILNTNPKKNPNPSNFTQDMEFMEKLDFLYPERKMTFKTAEVCLMPPEYTHQKFVEQGIDRPDLFSNTIEVADKIGAK